MLAQPEIARITAMHAKLKIIFFIFFSFFFNFLPFFYDIFKNIQALIKISKIDKDQFLSNPYFISKTI